MIVSDVTTRVLREFGDEASVQIEEADIIRWINDGLKHISVANDLNQATGLMTSVAGQADYAFPTDMLSMNSMYYDSAKLKYMKHTEFNEYIISTDPKQDQNGTPWMYTRWGTNFTLYPKPSTDIANGIKLLYIKRPADVALAADVLTIPLEYHPEVVKYCLQRAFQTDEDWDAANIMADQFQEGINRLKEQEVFQDREYYPVITVLADDW